MSDQALALRLADRLEHGRGDDVIYAKPAATELRRLHAENERLHRFELANNLWHEKTDWVQETAQPLELGRHRADVLKQRIERLHAVNAELLEALRWTARALHAEHPAAIKARAAIAKATGEPA